MQFASNVTRKSPIIKNVLQSNEKKKKNHYTLKVRIAMLYVSQDIRRIAVFAKYDLCFVTTPHLYHSDLLH